MIPWNKCPQISNQGPFQPWSLIGHSLLNLRFNSENQLHFACSNYFHLLHLCQMNLNLALPKAWPCVTHLFQTRALCAIDDVTHNWTNSLIEPVLFSPSLSSGPVVHYSKIGHISHKNISQIYSKYSYGSSKVLSSVCVCFVGLISAGW